jgi:mono/diheme cytochrome c family protein
MRKSIGVILMVGVVILVVYHLLIYYDNNFPYGRMWETPAVRPHEEPLLVMEAGTVSLNGGEEIYKATPEGALISPLIKGNSLDIEIGKKGYFNYCAQCHGTSHDGKGTVGQSFAPLPTDLRSKKVQETSEGKMFKEISYGVPDGRQPPLSTTIAALERWQIIAYVKSLGVRKQSLK